MILAELDTALQSTASEGRAALDALRADAKAARLALGETERATRALSGTLRSSLNRALTDAIHNGAKLSDILRGLALDIARGTAGRAVNALTGQLSSALTGGLAGFLPFAKGGAIDAGRVRRFARGGVLDGPALFPLRGGTGLAGEAGPEAILPLQRGADGRLGVAAGGGAAQVIVNISTPDIDSFRRAQGQVAATLARAVDRGRRNL